MLLQKEGDLHFNHVVLFVLAWVDTEERRSSQTLTGDTCRSMDRGTVNGKGAMQGNDAWTHKLHLRAVIC